MFFLSNEIFINIISFLDQKSSVIALYMGGQVQILCSVINGTPNIFLYFYDVSKNYIKSYMETSGRDYMSALCSYLLYPVLENKTEVQGTELGFAW